MQELQEIVKL